jgi:hypothetical protein
MKSKEVQTRLNLTESSKEGCGSENLLPTRTIKKRWIFIGGLMVPILEVVRTAG